MQIPSSPNSTNILIRPGVLGINNVFFFSSLLHLLISSIRKRGKSNGTGRTEKCKVLFI